MEKIVILNNSGLAITLGDKDVYKLIGISYEVYREKQIEKGTLIIKNLFTSASLNNIRIGDDCGITFTADVTSRNIVLRVALSDATYPADLIYTVDYKLS